LIWTLIFRRLQLEHPAWDFLCPLLDFCGTVVLSNGISPCLDVTWVWCRGSVPDLLDAEVAVVLGSSDNVVSLSTEEYQGSGDLRGLKRLDKDSENASVAGLTRAGWTSRVGVSQRVFLACPSITCLILMSSVGEGSFSRSIVNCSESHDSYWGWRMNVVTWLHRIAREICWWNLWKCISPTLGTLGLKLPQHHPRGLTEIFA
jgi:hypothetical protein